MAPREPALDDAVAAYNDAVVNAAREAGAAAAALTGRPRSAAQRERSSQSAGALLARAPARASPVSSRICGPELEARLQRTRRAGIAGAGRPRRAGRRYPTASRRWAVARHRWKQPNERNQHQPRRASEPAMASAAASC